MVGFPLGFGLGFSWDVYAGMGREMTEALTFCWSRLCLKKFMVLLEICGNMLYTLKNSNFMRG
jgi:hypothetical protein